MNNEQKHALSGAQASDPDALVSILICNYDGNHLGNCLDSILTQKQLRNFEIIICDDASRDSGWTIANRYALANPGVITIARNNTPFGYKENRKKGLQMCRGKYRVELTARDEFDTPYVGRTIEALKKDKFLNHAFVAKIKPANLFQSPQKKSRQEIAAHRSPQPLVSICIYNYNYGRYLRQCLGSVMAQTYENIEICFSDNASSDDSWEILSSFMEKYPEKISAVRNHTNFGAAINLRNCETLARGKYILKLCSDDAIRPDFVAQCVKWLERYPDAAFVMVHRDIIDDDGRISAEAPFYSDSCVIPGNEKAAVYMMASVNPSVSQILYSREKIESKRMVGNLNDRWYGDRLMDFHICCDFPVIYLKQPLLLNRVHDSSDGAKIENNLLQCLGQYVLVHQFADIASSQGNMNNVVERLDSATEKLGRLCIRYAIRALARSDEYTARRYHHLAKAIFPDVNNDSASEMLDEYWKSSPQKKQLTLESLLSKPNLSSRAISYPPPRGSLLLEDQLQQ